METFNNGNMNMNSNTNKSYPTKSRSNFSQAAVNKGDVGDFQAGYFVMAQPMPQHRPKTTNHNNNNKPHYERHTSLEKRNHRPPQQAHRARSTETDSSSRESDTNVSYGRLPTSPHRSPNRNKRNHSPPQTQQQSSYPQPESSSLSSPQKPHKAHVERENVSPTKDTTKRPSPPPNRWAGPAFSNAPPPSSLPIPDFPPFAPQAASSSPPSSPPLSSSPPTPSSPPQSAPTNMFLTPVTYQEPQFYIQPPLYANHHHLHHPFAYQASNHFAFAEYPQGSHLAQLSTDLRRMLNISSEQPVNA